jgi:hypothetical protein
MFIENLTCNGQPQQTHHTPDKPQFV